MNRRAVVLWLVALVAVATAYAGWQWYCWDTICEGRNPDGTRSAVVRCHWLPAALDGRFHYYLSFDPPIAFRPVPVETTLKMTASAAKNDQVVFDWATTHYMGYLQGFDDLEDRAPVSIQWAGERVVVRSRTGIAGEYEFQK